MQIRMPLNPHRRPARLGSLEIGRIIMYVLGFTGTNLSRRIIPNSGISSHRRRLEIILRIVVRSCGSESNGYKDAFAFSSCMASRWHSVWLLHYAGMDSLSGLRIGEVALTTSSNLSDGSNNFILFSGLRREARHPPGATSNNGVAAPRREKPARKTTVLKA
jgi:hypothetical protein